MLHKHERVHGVARKKNGRCPMHSGASLLGAASKGQITVDQKINIQAHTRIQLTLFYDQLQDYIKKELTMRFACSLTRFTLYLINKHFL